MTRSRRAVLIAFALLPVAGLLWLAIAGDEVLQPRSQVVSPAATPLPVQAAPAVAGAAALGELPAVADTRDSASQDRPPAVEPAQGQTEATDWLLGQLRDANAFRARAAAAVALGRRKGARVEAGLIEALRDDHPAVRTAAAGALSRFAGAAVQGALADAQAREVDRTAARALGRAQEKVASTTAPLAPAPAHAPRPAVTGGVYVSLSKLRTQAALDAALLSHAEAAARAAVRQLPNVRMAPPGESAQAATAVLSAERRAGYQLDVTLGLEDQPEGPRATANVLVATYPGRSILGLTKGAATGYGDPRDPELQRLVIERAVETAFSDLPQMFAAHGR